MTDDFDVFADDEEDGDASSDGDSKEDGAASTDEAPESGNESLRKMQSERDKETARANKLQKELDSTKAKPPARDESPFDPKAFPPEVREWLSASRDNVRQQLFDAEPKFKEFGFDPALITGATPAEMRTSAKELGKRVREMEAQIRNSVLVEHGFEPVPGGEERTPRKSFESMSSEEFDREVKRALGEL